MARVLGPRATLLLSILGVASLLSITAALGPVGLSPIRAEVPAKLTSVFLRDDLMRPISGGTVRVELSGGSEGFTGATDAYGQTRWMPLDPSGGVVLTIADNPVEGGLALGLLDAVVPPVLADGSVDAQEWYIGRSQPVAEHVLIASEPEGMANLVPGEAAYPHWRIGVPGESELQFQAGVAPLLDGPSIAAYLNYRGQPTAPDSYVRGTALTIPSIQLGEEGFFLGIDLLGDLPSPSSIAVDAYNLHDGASTEPGYDVSIALVEDGILYCHVTGELLGGHLAILARHTEDGGAGQEYSMPDDPPDLVIPTVGPPTTGWLDGDGERMSIDDDAAIASIAMEPCHACPSGTAATACEPEVPSMGNWDCTPVGGSSSSCPHTVLSHDCATTRTRSPRWCRGAGQSLTRQMGVKAKFTVKVEVSGGTAPLQSGGGFSFGHESEQVQTDSWTAQPGEHGLGQCIRYFRFYLDCGEYWSIGVEAMQEDPETGDLTAIPCGTNSITKKTCSDETDISAVCDMTP